MINFFTRIFLRLFSALFPTQKPTVFSGKGSSVKLGELLLASGQKRPLIVTEEFLLELGLPDSLFESLQDNGCTLTVFDGVEPNPTFEVIHNGLTACQEGRCDSVVVVGGGSAIDTAKVIAAGATNASTTIEKLSGILKIKQPTLPMYVVPTTSGTGSEVTNAAVVSETESHQKKFFVDPKLVPAAAALDPDMLKSLPPHITAATGMDALTHSIEAYVSLNSFDDAKRDARTAMKLIFKYLPVAFENGDDLEAREMLAIGSFLAGFAFSRSGLGYVHVISHQLSAHYNTPHGLANAILLPRITRFNQRVCTQDFAELEAMLQADDATSATPSELAAAFVARIDGLSDALQIPRELADLRQDDFENITKQALKEAKTSYATPRKMSARQCREILSTVVSGDREAAAAL